MTLPQRLAMVASLVPNDAHWVLDVGCEHGALSAALSTAGHRTIAIDCRPHLLQEARQRHPRLCALAAHGLDAVALPANCCIAIAGLGERQIETLLSPHLDRLNGPLVFQASTPPYALRRILADHGWHCTREDLCRSGRRFHTAGCWRRGPWPAGRPDDDTLLLGPGLVDHPLRSAFLSDQLQRHRAAASNDREGALRAALERALA
ncbi:MAG: tRNA (adenine(22)-N(1))-methyltransferase TrmK [Planctomycetota bacterium]|jgi:tRNA A22 N-methylase